MLEIHYVSSAKAKQIIKNNKRKEILSKWLKTPKGL